MLLELIQRMMMIFQCHVFRMILLNFMLMLLNPTVATMMQILFSILVALVLIMPRITLNFHHVRQVSKISFLVCLARGWIPTATAWTFLEQTVV
jgi:hypothetical protein